jgi:Ca2+-binding RTX toxin-like protein
MKRAVAALGALAVIVGLATPALAAPTYATGFEGFTLGSPNGQDGWSMTGPYDVAVVSPGITGGRAIRMSNAVTSGSFGDWLISPAVNPVAEGQRFDASFDLASVSAMLQAGLQISMSPQSGGGARMSFLRFEDQADGVHVIFSEVIGTSNPANFVNSDIATMTRAAHTVRIVMDLLPGPSNDVVRVFIDGVLRKTGTSWENFYRFGEGGPASPPAVDSLLFQARSSAGTAPTTLGAGFLIDNVSIAGMAIPAAPTITAITPSSAAPGASVTITGTNLTGAQVTVCGVAATETAVSATSVAFTVPTLAAQNCTVVVTTPGGTASTTLTVLAGPAPTPNCTIVGTSGPDTLIGTAGVDVVCAKAGADTVLSKEGDDNVKGAKGPDLLKGGKDNDLLRGGKGPDTLNGGPGFDTCKGGKGNDRFLNCEA